MDTLVETKKQNENKFKMVSVAEFCKRFRLHPNEERRLRLLFGHFAGEHELLRHATRAPRYR